MEERWTKGPWGHGEDTALSNLGTEPVLKSLLEFPAHQFAKEHGAASRKGAGQPHHLGPEILDGQIFLQLHAAQDGPELRNARALVGEKSSDLGGGSKIGGASKYWVPHVL